MGFYSQERNSVNMRRGPLGQLDPQKLKHRKGRANYNEGARTIN